MRYRGLRKTWILSASCIVLYALLALSGMLNKQKVWPNVSVDYLDGKQSFSLEDGDQYALVTNGPYTEMPAGVYRLKWQIEGDGVNVIRLLNSNEVEISPSEFKTVPGSFEGEAYFELKDTTHNFRINTEFCDGTWIAVHNFRLYSPVYRDNYITIAVLMLIAVFLVWLYESGKLQQPQAIVLMVLTIAVVFVSTPAMREDAIFGTDVEFHAARLRNLLDGLRNGQFPARVGGYSYNGYGAVTSVFYPDILLYPFALLLHLGASITYVLNSLIIVINMFAALCMYVAAKRIFSDYKAGVFAAIVYVCCGFRVDRLYSGFMVGQIMAMSFLPLFMLGLWEVFLGDKKNWPMLVVGATLVFQSHMVTTIMCAGVAGVVLIGFGSKLWREDRVNALLLAILTTILLNLTTLVPLITTYLSGVTTSVMQFGFVESAREVVYLLGPDKEIGLASILGIAAFLCADKRVVGSIRINIAYKMMFLGMVCAWMSTELFPWKYVLAYIGSFFEILQFPWRLLAIGTFAFALIAGLGYACLFHDQDLKGMLAVLAVAVLCVTPVIENALSINVMEFGMDSTPYFVTPEYQFEGTNLIDTKSRQVIIDGDLELAEYEKDGTWIRVKVDAKEDGKVTFPLFGFEGYQVTLNGKAIEWTRGENNRLCVALPAGTSGEVLVRYVGLAIWKIADVVSLLVLAGLSILGLRKREMN